MALASVLSCDQQRLGLGSLVGEEIQRCPCFFYKSQGGLEGVFFYKSQGGFVSAKIISTFFCILSEVLELHFHDLRACNVVPGC